MKVKIYKHQFIEATSHSDRDNVYFPWDWPEMKALDTMWPDDSPIEIEVDLYEQDEQFWEQVAPNDD